MLRAGVTNLLSACWSNGQFNIEEKMQRYCDIFRQWGVEGSDLNTYDNFDWEIQYFGKNAASKVMEI